MFFKDKKLPRCPLAVKNGDQIGPQSTGVVMSEYLKNGKRGQPVIYVLSAVLSKDSRMDQTISQVIHSANDDFHYF